MAKPWCFLIMCLFTSPLTLQQYAQYGHLNRGWRPHSYLRCLFKFPFQLNDLAQFGVGHVNTAVLTFIRLRFVDLLAVYSADNLPSANVHQFPVPLPVTNEQTKFSHGDDIAPIYFLFKFSLIMSIITRVIIIFLI